MTIEVIKAKGTAAIYCDNIIAYLDNVIEDPDQEPSVRSIEEFKSQLQTQIEQTKLEHQSNIEMFKSVIAAGQNAIKTSLTLNGAAAVAMLAFVGHLSRFNRSDVPLFADCIIPFTIGALTITITSGATYLSQWLYGQGSERSIKAGFVFNILTIILGISSYGFFIWGLVKSYAAFLTVS